MSTTGRGTRAAPEWMGNLRNCVVTNPLFPPLARTEISVNLFAGILLATFTTHVQNFMLAEFTASSSSYHFYNSTLLHSASFSSFNIAHKNTLRAHLCSGRRRPQGIAIAANNLLTDDTTQHILNYAAPAEKAPPPPVHHRFAIAGSFFGQEEGFIGLCGALSFLRTTGRYPRHSLSPCL